MYKKMTCVEKIKWKLERNMLRLCGILSYGAQKRKRRKKDRKKENGLPWKKTHFPLRISRSRAHAHSFAPSKSEENRREFVR